MLCSYLENLESVMFTLFFLVILTHIFTLYKVNRKVLMFLVKPA